MRRRSGAHNDGHPLRNPEIPAIMIAVVTGGDDVGLIVPAAIGGENQVIGRRKIARRRPAPAQGPGALGSRPFRHLTVTPEASAILIAKGLFSCRHELGGDLPTAHRPARASLRSRRLSFSTSSFSRK